MQRAAAVKPKARPRSLGDPSHGSNIYAYCNVRTRQVLYSLTRSLDSYQSLKQLPQLGPNTVPPKLRKDLWKPLYTISLPEPEHPYARSPIPRQPNPQGLDAFAKLREYRRLHELYWEPTEELSRKYSKDEIKDLQDKYDKRGGSKKESVYDIIKREKKKLRRGIVMDQKANSIADLAAVLSAQEKQGADRFGTQMQEAQLDRSQEIEKIMRLCRPARLHGGGLNRVDREIERVRETIKQIKEDRQQGKEVERGLTQTKQNQLYRLQRKKRDMAWAHETYKAVEERIASSHAFVRKLREGDEQFELPADGSDVASEAEQVIAALERKWDLADEKREQASRIEQEIRSEEVADEGHQPGSTETSQSAEQNQARHEEARFLLEEAERLELDLKPLETVEAKDRPTIDIADKRAGVLNTSSEALQRARNIYRSLDADLRRLKGRMKSENKIRKELTDALHLREGEIRQTLEQLTRPVAKARARAREEAESRASTEGSEITVSETKHEQMLRDQELLAQRDSLLAELEQGRNDHEKALKEVEEERTTSRKRLELRAKLAAVEHVLVTRGVGPEPHPVLERVLKSDAAENVEAVGEKQEADTMTAEAGATSNGSEIPPADASASSDNAVPTDPAISHEPIQTPEPRLVAFHELLPSFPRPNIDPSTLPKHDKIKHKLRRLAAPIFKTRGVKVQWANILDAEFAEQWPEHVEHEPMGLVRHTAKHPDYDAKMTVLDTAPHIEERAIEHGNIEADEVDEVDEEVQLEDAETQAVKRRQEKKAERQSEQVARKAVLDSLAQQMVAKLRDPQLKPLKTREAIKRSREQSRQHRAKRLERMVGGGAGEGSSADVNA
ncbi:uncharacterized protein LTR77_007300 [Saxophila tyrrhenica]|uniref:Large ribosomal subunit protein mL67 n=1 Tax=Saxophila tyrrhenica TaxID=1690608 RepID=A0AAV9P697_9PEZI|nr:hypothetical protein LTR77_007300 [Saxophila tyrrhenica]